MVPQDINGKDVVVGSKVKVLSIDKGILQSLPIVEVADVKSMVGEVFEVYEINGEYASVEKWWNRGQGRSESHSIALARHEMELVDGGSS
ncbi:MAG: hypothetical protein ABW092_06000 [Candidatus Thiodiazotropha sp.]